MQQNEKINILEIGDGFFPHLDGVTNVIHHYATELNKQVNVIVCAPAKPGYDYSYLPYRFVGVPSIHIPFMDFETPWPLLSYSVIKKIITTTQIDIIHTHSPMIIGPVIQKLAKKYGIIVISTLHSRYTEDFKRFVPTKWLRAILTRRMAKYYQSCDEVWTVNRGMTSELVKIGYQGKIRVMPNATDFEPSILSEDARIEVTRKYRLNPNLPICLYVGQQSIKKNIPLTLKAIAKLKSLGFITQYLSVGVGEDALMLKHLVKELKIDDQVFFIGKISDRNELKKIYEISDLFVFPSTYDASSLAVIEAAATSVPSLLIRGAITAEAITDEINGYLCEETIDDLANRIRYALTDEKRKVIGDQAHKSLTRTWSEVVENVLSTYREIIDKKC